MADVDTRALQETVAALLADGKGILAVDETPGTLTSRFQSLGIESTETSRRDYRELLFRTRDASCYISGAILNDENIRQRAADGTPVPELLAAVGIVPGIKVDRGLHPLAGAPGELVTEGLDGLRPRLEEYRRMGARFTKWRALFNLGPGMPTAPCIEANAHALVRYAALAHEAALVPIVETEVLIDGDHSIDRCAEVTETVLHEVFDQLYRQRVRLEAVLLKPSMVVPGKHASQQVGTEEVAERTVATLMRTVPAAVPGIVFLSGGQSDAQATANLNAIVRTGARRGAPWQLSFSFARALQGAPMKAWAGRPENTALAQEVFRHRAAMSSAARRGAYDPALDRGPVPA